MSRRFIHDILQTWDNFKPRPRVMIENGTTWDYTVPKWNGLTITKEI